MAKIGRPTKYHDKMPELLIEAMGQGLSVIRFCAQQGISKDAFYEWVKVHPLFNDAFIHAKQLCESYWERWLVENLANKNVNAILVKLFFANRFGWHDKKEIDQKTEHSVGDNTQRKVREVLDA